MPRLMNRQQGHVATEQNSLWMIYRKARSYQQKQSTLFRSSIQLKKPFISSSFTARSEHPEAASTDSSNAATNKTTSKQLRARTRIRTTSKHHESTPIRYAELTQQHTGPRFCNHGQNGPTKRAIPLIPSERIRPERLGTRSLNARITAK